MKSGHSTFESCRKRKDGSLIQVDISTRVIRDVQGRVKYVLSSNRDITHRKRADERLRLVVEAAPSAMLMLDAQGKIMLANTQAERLFGYTRAELLQRPVEMLLPERYREMHPAHRSDFFQHPRSRPMGVGRDFYGLRNDGSEVPIEIGLNPIQTAEGPFVLASIIDLTERKTADAALKSSELRYRRLFESAKDGILILDADSGQIVDVNPFLIDMLGFSKEQLAGKELWEIGLFKDIVASKRAFVELQQHGFIRYENLPLETRNGTVRQVEFVSNSYLAGGSCVVQCNIRDITERKLAEEEKREAEARYRTLFDYAPAGIVISDPESYYIDANATMCRMLGYTRKELIGLHASDIVAAPEIKHIENALNTLTGELDHKREWEFRRKDNSVFTAEVIATMMPDGNLLGVVHDITERKLAEEDLRQTNQRLEGALAELQIRTRELATMTQQLWQASKLATMGELAASVAHELNNPLATISLRAELLIDQLALEDPNRASVVVIEQEVGRMATLISNLLLFSRRSQLQISTLDLREELTSSLDLIEYHLRNHNIDIVTDCATGLPSVYADRQQLQQVFLNLITNAGDAMPEGGTLFVRCHAAVTVDGKAAVVVEFSDTGTGIQTRDLESIWEPFFTTKPEGKGTGLGLAICRRAVDEHRGTIEIETSPGEGTTVRITLPAGGEGARVSS